jgi:hypothetical protein
MLPAIRIHLQLQVVQEMAGQHQMNESTKSRHYQRRLPRVRKITHLVLSSMLCLVGILWHAHTLRGR